MNKKCRICRKKVKRLLFNAWNTELGQITYFLLVYITTQLRSIHIFSIGLHSRQGSTATTTPGVTKKEDEKEEKNIGKLFRKSLKKRVSSNSRLKTI